MKKVFLQSIAWTVFFLLGANAVAASDVIISQVLYTSDNDQSKEFVEIYNKGGSPVDISGWFVDTRLKADATIPAGTTLAAGSYYLVADNGWSDAKSQNWPDANHDGEEITLANSNAGVAIRNGDTVVDAVGWGNPASISSSSLYEGTPHSGASRGEALARKKQSGAYVDTDNNANDFIAAAPSFGSSRNSQAPAQNQNQNQDQSQSQNNQAPVQGNNQIQMVASISGPNLSMHSLSILTDDDSLSNGTQINPAPKRNKRVQVQAVVNVSHVERMRSVVLNFDGSSYTMTQSLIDNRSARYSGEFNLSYQKPAGNYNLSVVATDVAGSSVSSAANFEYASLVAMEMDAASLMFEAMPGMTSEIPGDTNESTGSNATIGNIGNSRLDVRISGTNLTSSNGVIGAGNVQYTFDGNYSSNLAGNLSESGETKQVGMASAGKSPLSFRLNVPTLTTPGDYRGTITLIAVGR